MGGMSQDGSDGEFHRMAVTGNVTGWRCRGNVTGWQ